MSSNDDPHGMSNTAPDGFKIPFSAGHTRRMPRLTHGPFRYERYAGSYLEVAMRYAGVPLKQAVSSPSETERARIGVPTCPGSDRDSTHSAEVDYASLLPSLFQLKVGNFYIAFAKIRARVSGAMLADQALGGTQ